MIRVLILLAVLIVVGCDTIPAKDSGETFRVELYSNGSVSPMRSAQDCCDAICNGYPITIASNAGFGSISPRDGRQVGRWTIAFELQPEGVASIDPATIAMLISILTQAAKLLAWWKPEWFVSWQVSRLIDRETTHTYLAYQQPKLKRLVMATVIDDIELF